MKGVYRIENEEFKKYAELYVEVFNAHPWNDHWTIETAYKKLIDIYLSPGFLGYKYMEEEQIKGAVFGNCEQWYNGIHFNLKEMFVSTELQGKGIGRKMLEQLEIELKGLAVEAIFLFTSKGNLTDKFYKKCGFAEYNHMVMMGKSI